MTPPISHPLADAYLLPQAQPRHQVAERLSAQADLGFWALPEAAAHMIPTYLSAPHGGRAGDICGGRGVALDIICNALGITKSARYINELHDERAQACKDVAAHVVTCDTLKALQGSPRMFNLLYANPPFGSDGKEEGGGRLEPKFFRRAIEDGGRLQNGGITVIVTPQDILARVECANHLARCYDQLSFWALPDDIRQFREVVVFGVLRETYRLGAEQRAESKRLQTLLEGELPTLAPQDSPLYVLPKPQALRKLIWRDASKGNAVMAQNDVIKGGGAWSSKSYRAARSSLHTTQLAPLFPLDKKKAAMRMAAGAINGVEVEIAGVRQRIKGTTIEDVVTWTEESETDKAHTVATHSITRRIPHVVTMDATGTIRRFVGDKGMAKLRAYEGASDALLQAVEQAAPPRYRLDMEPHLAAVLDGIKPASGRALPGYRPGLLQMQKHVVAAIYRALTTPDPSWDGQVPNAQIIAAEMGVGKTSLGLALAEVLRVMTQTHPPAIGRSA